MIRIPTNTKKHAVSNSSDLFGTIHYGKNINLDEEGYIKLSSRTVSLVSELDYSNLGLPTAFGRGTLTSSPEESVDFAVTQNRTKGYWLTLLVSSITINPDVGTNAPTLTADAHAAWFRNLWTVTSDTDLWTKGGLADSETYTDRGNLTTGKAHPVEAFKNRNTVCVGDGNTVLQFDTSYSASTTLTLPTDFEVIGQKYSNNLMGVLTMFSDVSTGKNQNQEAYFFTWTGASTSASQGVPVGSDKAIAIAPYKGSWVIVTRSGQWWLWTGGGFTQLTAFPFYFKNHVWGTAYTRDLLGDLMLVEGDVIYMNTNGLLQASGKRYEQFSVESPGGIQCFDPNVAGNYTRYTPSISPATHIQVAQADVNTTTDIMTITAAGATEINGTIPPTGSPLKYVHDKTSPIGGLTPNTVYYCIKHNATTFSLATTKALAEAGTKINLTSTGAANNYFFGLEVRDYGASYANKSGAVASMGKVHPMYDHLIFGSELNDYNGTGNSYHWLLTVPDFENRGYFVTPKIQSLDASDKAQKVYVKYRTLKTDDKIIVKVKDKDYSGLPVSTPQSTSSTVNQCAWQGATTFSTTANLADAKTAFDAGAELECEVIAGAGAGTLTKISNITYDGTTYSVELSENVDGAASSRYCDVVIDAWKVLGTITSDDTSGYKAFLIGRTAPWFKYKIELRGSETTVEEVGHVQSVHKPAA